MKILVTVLTALIFLSACGGEGGLGGDPYFERDIKLDDGRVVVCVVFQSVNEGGLSCDWDNAATSEESE